MVVAKIEQLLAELKDEQSRKNRFLAVFELNELIELAIELSDFKQIASEPIAEIKRVEESVTFQEKIWLRGNVFLKAIKELDENSLVLSQIEKVYNYCHGRRMEIDEYVDKHVDKTGLEHGTVLQYTIENNYKDDFGKSPCENEILD